MSVVSSLFNKFACSVLEITVHFFVAASAGGQKQKQQFSVTNHEQQWMLYFRFWSMKSLTRQAESSSVLRCPLPPSLSCLRNGQVCEFFQVVCRYLADHLLTPALRCANNLLPKPASNAASAALREMKGGAGQLPPRVSDGALLSLVLVLMLRWCWLRSASWCLCLVLDKMWTNQHHGCSWCCSL